MKDSFAFFTVCNIQYLPKAKVLARSLFEIQKVRLIIYLFDKKDDKVQSDEFCDIHWITEQNIPNFNHIAFMYDVTEACTSVKPFLTLRLLESYKAVIYLDPDICIYSDFSELLSVLNDFPIVLTPHYLEPLNNKEDGYDLSMMRFGSFNLGFYAVNDSEESIRFLNWWSERCINLCFAESQFGLSVDQKWVSISPCFFEKIKILFDPGYNMAFWNIRERYLEESNGSLIVNKKYILKFFHFSSFDIDNPQLISKRPHPWNKTGREDLNKICTEYGSRLAECDNGLSQVRYSFDYMSNGDYISPVLRRAYAAVYDELPPEHDPFDSDGIVGKFMRKNHLRVKNNTHFKPMYESNLNGFKWQFRIANSMMRLLLILVGANSFSNFSRFLVFMSSYRKNRALWRL